MAHYTYDPATEACSPEYISDPMTYNAGPGGNTTLIENNEKGILETKIQYCISHDAESAPRTMDKSNRIGIYGSKY